VLGYTRDTFERSTVISATEPAKIDEAGRTFEVRLELHGSWTTEIDVATLRFLAVDGRRCAPPGRPFALVRDDVRQRQHLDQQVPEGAARLGEHAEVS
jgi:hypothetical protein